MVNENKKISAIEKELFEGDWNTAIELNDGKMIVYNRNKTSLGASYAEIPLVNVQDVSVQDIYNHLIGNYHGLPSQKDSIAKVKNDVLFVAEGYDTMGNIFAPLTNYK